MSNNILNKWYVAFGFALICLCGIGPISINFFEIPLTLQTLVICLASVYLGFPAVLATVAYVIMGIQGVPILSGFEAKLEIMNTASAGFLIGFPLMSLFLVILRKRVKRSFVNSLKYFVMAHLLLIADAYLYNSICNLPFPSISKIAFYLVPSLLVKSVFASLVVLIVSQNLWKRRSSDN